MQKNRSKAFFINGGAGRVLCSIPALEKYYEETQDENFIIVCEGGTELYKGHPLLDIRSYDHWHKNLFKDRLKHMDLVTPEPYRVWEYYNQQCSLTQAFDIAINDKGIRELAKPRIYLSRDEEILGFKLVEEIKNKLKKKNIVVFQPFGRGIQENNGLLFDSTGRSFDTDNVTNLIKKIQKQDWGIVLMSEIKIDLKKAGMEEEIAQPENANLRVWASIIKSSNLFVGCDSVGQHISYISDVPTIVVLGSTFPINVSYQESEAFKVMDLGENDRQYAPIRVVMDEAVDRNNERLMYMTDDIENYLIDLAKKTIKKDSDEESKKPTVKDIKKSLMAGALESK